MPDIAGRKRDEIRRKLEGFPIELRRWVAESEPKGLYEKHNSQIRKLVPQMLQLHDPIVKEFESLTDDSSLLAEARRIEARALAVHTVWDYFRSKFVMRAQEPFASFLKVADSFAWACYGPVQAMYSGKDRREPPLVALQNAWSPWALPRGRMYNVLFAPGGWTNTQPFIDVIQALPVPILGVPWLQVEHLPHVTLLAHEVGHVIEFDLNAQPAIVKAVSNTKLDANRKPAWEAWETELFADWFGCYAAGPSFVWSLAEILATTPNTILTEQKEENWGAYPTTTLRIRFNLAVLRVLGWTDEAEEIGKEWNSTYPTHQMQAFEKDAESVAQALSDAKLVPDDMIYNQKQDEMRLRALLQASQPLPDSIIDPRGPVALAGSLLRDNPNGPRLREHWQALRDHIVRIRPKGVLAGTTEPEAPATTEKIQKLASDFFLEVDRMSSEID